VPTPFYHLSIAHELLRNQAFDRPVLQSLNDHKCAFLLGNTAPDVQVVSGEPRENTHFFLLPLNRNTQTPWKVFLKHYPDHRNIFRYAEAHLAFLAGYLCHLQADWLWIQKVYAPVFGPTQKWDTFSYRLYIHNVLRAYQDARILSSLPEGTGACLDEVEPHGWLPFVKDEHLIEWRNYLSKQLHPGSLAQTVEVFSQRQGISPAEFYSLLSSKDRMENEVFSRVSELELEEFRQTLIQENIKLLQDFYPSSFISDRYIGESII
jgi:hypothetical protein